MLSAKSYGETIGKACGLVLGMVIAAKISALLTASPSYPAARSVEPRLSEKTAAMAKDTYDAGSQPSPSLLAPEFKKLSSADRQNAQRILSILNEPNGWEMLKRDELVTLAANDFIQAYIQHALQLYLDRDRWHVLPTNKQQEYSRFLSNFYGVVVNGALQSTQEQWNSDSIEKRQANCDHAQTCLKSQGATEAEAREFSVFLGGFMETAPSHATIQDALLIFYDDLKERRRAQNLAALNEIIDLSAAGAQLIQTMSARSN